MGLKLGTLILAGAASTAAGVLIAHETVAAVAQVGGAALLLVAMAMLVSGILRRRNERAVLRVIDGFAGGDAMPVLVTDVDGRVTYCNRTAMDRFGKGADLVGTHLFSHIFAAPAGTLRRMLDRAAASGSAREDRVSRNGHLRVVVVRGPGGRFLWWMEDVGARDAEPGSLDLSLPVAVAGETGQITAANAAMRALIGGGPAASVQQVFGRPTVATGEVHAFAADGMQEHRRVLEVRGEGGAQEIYLLPERFGGDDNAGRLFDTLPVPLLKIAPGGEILLANRSASELLNSPIPPGTELGSLVSGLGRSVKDWLNEAAEGKGLNRSEFLQVTTAGKDIFVQVTLKRVVEEGATRLVAVLNDATELKTLEAQFVQSQKMQAIGQLAGGVAHDFNNLLTAISGHCDLLLLRHDHVDPEYGDLVQIHQNANRAASLVGQLLAFSRKQTLQPQVVDLRDTLSDLTHLLNRLVGERVRLMLRHDPNLPPIRADKRQLEQVLMNLVVNARDAMPSGGEVVIETSTAHLENEIVRNRAAIPPGDYVVVRVSDEGVGIPPEKLPKIFEPFYTTKKTGEGTGLGLSTAYGIVKQTGGYIFAESTVGVGTHFTLYFPAFVAPKAEVAKTKEPARRANVGRSEGVVLLVEDEAPVRAFASRALQLKGYTVVEAENAEEALAKLEDPELTVDIFVTDVVMPGMDGPTWVREALKDRPGVRVVFMSGYAEDALNDDRSPAPDSAFLPKPFSLQDLVTTVQDQLQ